MCIKTIWIAGLQLSSENKILWEKELDHFFDRVHVSHKNIFNDGYAFGLSYSFSYFKKHEEDNLITKEDNVLVDGYIKVGETYYNENNYQNVSAEHLFKTINENLTELHGEFSFAHLNKDRIFLISDFYASRPIYYYTNKKSIIISNDLRALILNPMVELKVNEEVLPLSLSSWVSTGENELSSELTYFEGIRKLKPHHCMVANIDGIRSYPYLDMQRDIIDGSAIENVHDYPSSFKSLFDAIIYERTQKTKTTILLSGGIDSSTILASLTQTKNPEDIYAINMSFRDPDQCNNQNTQIAKKLIEYFGVKGGILWSDDLLRIPNPLTHGDPFDLVNGPNPLANKLVVEGVQYYSQNENNGVILTGEQGDAVLGEDNVTMIFDSLFYHGHINAIFKTLNTFNSGKGIGESAYNYFKFFLLNIIPIVRNKIYKHIYWSHVHVKNIPSFLSKEIEKIEKDLKRNHSFLSSEFTFKNVWSKYVFDYFFPKAAYYDTLSIGTNQYHPFADRRILNLILNSPSHIHFDYENYSINESYRRSKFLAREAYKGILPEFAREKAIKTSYSGMARKIVQNSKEMLIDTFFGSELFLLSERGLVDANKFRKTLGATLLRVADPNNNLRLNFRYLQCAIQLEIWLRVIQQPKNQLTKMLQIKPPRKLGELESIR